TVVDVNVETNLRLPGPPGEPGHLNGSEGLVFMGDHTDGGHAAADIVLLGGVVHRFDGAAPAEALAVRGQWVQQVGTDDQIRALIGPHTRVVDLSDRAVLPGINESHLHATWLGL